MRAAPTFKGQKIFHSKFFCFSAQNYCGKKKLSLLFIHIVKKLDAKRLEIS